MTLTGLGLKIAGLIVALAGGQLFLTVLYSAFAVRMLGLAVPVTALVHHRGGHGGAGDDPGRRAGCGGAHVHLLLRGAVGSQPADGALAVCRSRDHRRAPVSHDDADVEVHAAGVRLPVRVHVERAGHGSADAGDRSDVVLSTATAIAGIVALAAGLGGWMRGPATPLERALATAGGLLLFYAGTLTDVAGMVLFAAAIVMHSAAEVRLSRTGDDGTGYHRCRFAA